MPDWVLDEADVIVGQRVSQPGATKRWRRLAEGVYGRRPMLVFEIDDDLWDIDPSNGPAWNFYQRSPELLENLPECARLADVCTVSTEPLAGVVRRINPNVVVLPNQLPDSAFANGVKILTKSRLRIGWGGGASHVLDVDEMAPALRQWFRRRPGDTFVNMGTLFDSVRRAVGGSLEQLAWTEDLAEHYRRVAGLDIGLAPLRPSMFNRSKSELKFLEYAAAGVACIASRVGPYERAIRNTFTGVLVSQPHEWASELHRMVTHLDQRAEIEKRALEYVQTRRIADHWQSWEQVYTG
jgi:glycosyltransferase involved in cell wall biosynthesis